MKNWNWPNVLKAHTYENVIAQMVVGAALMIGYGTYTVIADRREVKRIKDRTAKYATQL